MNLSIARAEIARYYGNALGHVTVFQHGGPFSLAEVKRISKKSPAVAIVCLRLPGTESSGHDILSEVSFGAFCFSNNRKKILRDVEALDLSERVLVHLNRNRWPDKDGTDSASGPPREISAANLYSTALDELGVALWAVSWKQRVTLDRDETTTTLEDFETLYSTYDLDEEVDAEDLTDVTELDT